MRKPESEKETSNGAAADRMGVGKRAPRRRLSAPERRAALLEAALPCFARRGYAGTGTRDLARAAGVTEPILYRHFPSKAGLFQAVLELAAERLIAAAEAAVAGHGSADARLAALASSLPDIIDTLGAELRVVNAGALVLEEQEIIAATAGCAQRIGRALGQAFRGTGLRSGVRAETAGFLLLEIGLGAAMLRPLRVAEMEGPDFVERAVDALLHGLS